MITDEMLKNPDFGGITIQRFVGGEFIRVCIKDSNVSDALLLDEAGIFVFPPHLDVVADDAIPLAIEQLWAELQRCLHRGRSGRRNVMGLFFCDPLPAHLSTLIGEQHEDS